MNCSLYNNTNTTSTPNATAATTTECILQNMSGGRPLLSRSWAGATLTQYHMLITSGAGVNDLITLVALIALHVVFGGGGGGVLFFLQSNLDDVVPNLLISIPGTLLGIHVEFLVMARKDLQPLLFIRLWRPFCSFNCVV